MTVSSTATVEVLSAEVRVLQVGRRQVTMSVWRQLDHVEPEEIQPFGRVNDNDDGTWVSVVGRDSSGALVRSWVHEQGRSMERARHAREREDAIAREWGELPLIVLAGLR